MKTSEIERLSNRGDIAKEDLDLKAILRRKCVPRFIRDVAKRNGRLWTLRATLSISVSANDNEYDLPATSNINQVEWIRELRIYSASQGYPPLKYIGEDPEMMLQAEATTTPSRPTGYWIVAGSAAGLKAIHLNRIPDAAYTVRGVYYKRVPWADAASDVELDPYFETDYQYGLVHLLRAEIMLDRFGVQDNRYEAENGEYAAWLDSLDVDAEPSARNYVITVD